jgi:hypothetical protein
MNYFLNDYLVKCDLIQKYNLKNITLIPKVKQIKVALKITEKGELGQTSSSTFLKLQLFLIIYIIFLSYPYIQYSKSKISKENFFVIHSTISEPSSIYSFLDSFFIDNFYKVKKSTFLSLNFLKRKSFLQKKNVLTIKVPLSFFDEVNEFSSIHNLNIKELYMLVSFSIENPSFLKIKNNKFFLKNLPYFWAFN